MSSTLQNTDYKNTEKPLLIYSASAGSGKTYMLVKTYLELILKGDTNPKNFSKIIAMTFTNKAALEMKNRIVEALADLSQPNRHEDLKKRKKALQYGKDIAFDFETTPEELTQKAHIALTHILHQYEDFFVMTIDKFNLRLIRSFAMDLDIESNFKVVIDETEIKQRVITDFLNEIDADVSSLLSTIFLQIASNRVSEGQGWNFEYELADYLNILDREDTIEMISQVSSEINIQDFFKRINAEINYLEEKFQAASTAYLQRYEADMEATPKFNGTKQKFIYTLAEKLRTQPINKKNLFTVTNIRYVEQEELPEPILSTIKDFYEALTSYFIDIEKAKKIKESFLYIHLLKKINERLKEFRKTEQIIRISEFNHMISDLLRNESAPYIYEKLGTRFNNFLLDEFQDTSILQWQNIVPLIHESISHQHKNLIVGDPKQSIYRFRGGTADQFVALPAIYNPKNDVHINTLSHYFKKMGIKKKLEDNYRSSKDIVEFNNLFFNQFIQFIRLRSNDICDFTNYYDDITQNPKNENVGFVEINSIHLKTNNRKVDNEDDDNGENSEEETSEINIEYLIKCVNECLEDGYEKGDICVLGDVAKDCNKYAIALANEGHSVVSEDSLAVNSDVTVKLCLNYLNWRNQPANELLAMQFIDAFFALKHPESATQKFKSYIEQRESLTQKDKMISYCNYKRFVSDYFDNWESFHFSFENLYTLLEKFYKLINVNELNNPYLHHLADLAFSFDLNNGPDLSAFITYYTNKGLKSSIQTPENKDAIKIMTSHKSKGLEFKVVIIPQLSKSFLRANNKYVVKIENELVYTKVSKKVVSEELKVKYLEEFRANLLDKLNLCYVAFTRPVDRLYVMSSFSRKDETDFGASFIHPFLKSTTFDTNRTYADENKIVVQFGERVKLALKGDVSDKLDSKFFPLDVSDTLWFPQISLKHHLEDKEDSIAEHLRYGTQLHVLLSELENHQTIDNLLIAFEKKGLVENKFVPKLKSDLQRITTDSKYIELHQGGTQVINEQAIIISDKEVKRPDKIIVKENETVIIDYKTGLKDAKHQRQVKNYCAILSEMQFPNVKGYILYTQDLEFVTC